MSNYIKGTGWGQPPEGWEPRRTYDNVRAELAEKLDPLPLDELDQGLQVSKSLQLTMTDRKAAKGAQRMINALSRKRKGKEWVYQTRLSDNVLWVRKVSP